MTNKMKHKRYSLSDPIIPENEEMGKWHNIYNLDGDVVFEVELSFVEYEDDEEDCLQNNLEEK